MLIELLATLVISLTNPADPTGKTIYPSGLHDCDGGFTLAPASEYPVLKVTVSIIGKNGTIVNPGMYQAVLRNKEIILIEEGHVIAVLPVIVEKKLSQMCIIPEATETTLDQDYVQINLKQNQVEAESIVRISR